MENSELLVAGILVILIALLVLVLWRQEGLIQDQKAILEWLSEIRAYKCLD